MTHADSHLADDDSRAPTLRRAALTGALVAFVGLWPGPGDNYVRADDSTERMTWPFAGFSADEIRNYIDERAIALAINLVTQRAALTLRGHARLIEFPLSRLDPRDCDVLPVMWPK